jgi:hypothetical protein
MAERDRGKRQALLQEVPEQFRDWVEKLVRISFEHPARSEQK